MTRLTNFERNVDTMRAAMHRGINANILLKRYKSGAYVYEAYARYEPGKEIVYPVRKLDAAGNMLATVICISTWYGVRGDTRVIKTPSAIDREIIDFNGAIYANSPNVIGMQSKRAENAFFSMPADAKSAVLRRSLARIKNLQ